jgi:hypothetical protein
MNAIKKLYNGILNDSSIQRYSLNWKDVVTAIEKKYKGKENIRKRPDIQFTDQLLETAQKVSKGSLSMLLYKMQKELQINVQTLKEKSF